jgi:mannose-6-phosphate isomerase-like protein (cupin superfamily)
MKKLIPLLVPAGLLVLLFLPLHGTVSGHDIVDIGDGFAESPVPGVRIIRERDYDKRPAHYVSSSLYTTLAAARETGHRFAAFDFQVPPGGGPLPHTHRYEWETFFVSQGEVTFTVGVEDFPPFEFITEVNRPAGTLVYGPQGPVHGFLNESGSPARMFIFGLPAGLDVFFETVGERVRDFEAPIPRSGPEEIMRLAFWGEQTGRLLHIPGTPPPEVPATTPEHVISSITGEGRPKFEGPFGEERVSLVTPEEVGNITGATAFCGPGAPGRPGGTVAYSSFLLGPRDRFPASVTSNNVEVFYTLGGRLSFKFEDEIVTVETLTYVEIQPGVPFSIANLATESSRGDARSLAISVIAPDCPPPPGGGPG